MRCSSFKIVKLFAGLGQSLLKKSANPVCLFIFYHLLCWYIHFHCYVYNLFSNFPLLPETLRTSAHFNNSGVIRKSLQSIVWSQFTINPLSSSSDLDRISSYMISMISSRQVMRVTKISIRGLLVDPIPYSPNYHHINCMADSKENYSQNLGC